MKIPSTILFLLSSTLALGQFAIIQDTDGYCNVRQSAGTNEKVINKLKSGHMVYEFERKGNWVYINYSQNNSEVYGYVYYDRLKPISDYESIPITSKEDHSITLSKGDIKVLIAEQKFDKSKYKFSYYKDAPDQIEFINKKQYWGIDGGLPTREYKAVTIHAQKRNIILPKSALANLFEPTLRTIEVNYDRSNDIFYINSMNSDGAGAYYVIWKIEKGIYKERLVVYGF